MPASTSTDVRHGVKRALAVVAVATLTVAGCAAPSTLDAVAPTTTEASSTPPPPAPTSSTTPLPGPTDALRADFETLSAEVAAQVGVAIVAGPTVATFGSWTTGVAWSTIKVPLAIAALRAAPEQAPAFVPAAISRSDNAAAESLWSLLGDPDQAARAVQEILREGGDETTVVQAERVRAGFTAFGQTDWPMAAQARFAWRLPCVGGHEPVVADMLTIAGDQVWGLADNSDVAAKGGWGPGPDGGYLVRQLATISGPTGSVGVALAAQPDDGTFGSGVAAVNQLAAWVSEHRDAFVPTRC